MLFGNMHFGNGCSKIKNEIMKFYNREKEISRLQEIQSQSVKNAKFTVFTGRRRIGKTHLLLHATKDNPTLYFFMARKAESLLCQDFVQEVKEKLKIPVLGEVSSFGKLFKFLMEHSQKTPFNLIIDEFQEFYHIAPYVYSEMQHHWDVNNDKRKNCGRKAMHSCGQPVSSRTTKSAIGDYR